VAYFDASAFVKLVLPERESTALRETANGWRHWVSSALLEVEAVVGARRRDARAADAARALLETVDLIDIDADIRRAAGDLRDPRLRSLDAIHLATALCLGDHLGTLFTYDDRLAAAAQAHGLTVSVPQP
jgi:uncharacterized protein